MIRQLSQPTNDDECKLSPSDRGGVEVSGEGLLGDHSPSGIRLPVLPPECIALIIGHLLMSGSFDSIIKEWKGEALRQFRLLSPRSRMRLAITSNSRELVNEAMKDARNSISARGWEAPKLARERGSCTALNAMRDHQRSQSSGVQRMLQYIASRPVRV